MDELQATDDMPHVMRVGHESYLHMDSTYKGMSYGQCLQWDNSISVMASMMISERRNVLYGPIIFDC